ncbi:MAG: type II and III secretion system protein family protein [Acetobacteraceae bacterium]
MAPEPNSVSALLRPLLGLFVAVATLLAIAVGLADAQQPSMVRRTLALDVDKAQLITLPEPASTVFVANPDIADVQVPGQSGQSSFLVFGRKPGETTIYALMGGGKAIGYAVTVRRAIGDVAGAIRRAVPDAKVSVSGTPGGLVITGRVATPADAQKVRETARQFIGEKENIDFNVAVEGATQVNLRVRVAEVSRSTDRQFGFNWAALFNNGSIAVGLLTGRLPVTSFGNFIRDTSLNPVSSLGFGYRGNGGKTDISVLLDLLQAEGLVTILAEPNLTAVSGETAEFLAGGEFPIPVAQALQQVTLEFKRFGVSVAFTPTVLSEDRMSIKVRPEVSELTDVGAVEINGIKVPGIAVRRASTTVEMASGQSFAIAGLFQNNVSNQIKQLPWLGDIPILGALFRSTHYQRNESELVIIVTPYIVRPAAKPSDLQIPTDGLVWASDIEQILLGRLTAPNTGPRPRLNGAAGFMLE